jgi:K+ transporter
LRLHDLAQRTALLRAALRAVAVPLTRNCRNCWRACREFRARRCSSPAIPRYVPTAMLRNLEHNHVAHRAHRVADNWRSRVRPRQDPAGRVRIEQLMPEIYAVTRASASWRQPDVSEALKQCRARGLKLFAQDCSFFLGWHLVVPRPRGGYEGLQAPAVCLDAASAARRRWSSFACPISA